ncbi:hypothetical protein LTR64_002438 [Lithohypha guttulata]|uniref:uncharacterized protein n=1 Tax=Lithohypha guttulata TaxID=1690604 RepID=UPI002DDF39B0|nr:hypothetical protein LTR51_001336 [Lithohypha guttulata]
MSLQHILLQPKLLLVSVLIFLAIFSLHARLGTLRSAYATIGVQDDDSHHEPDGPDWQARLADVQNSTLGFQKVFAISLSERTDHRDTLALTSALTGFEVDFIDGVKPSDISEKAMPPNPGIGDGGARGAWRGHMNALRKVVAEGIGSALIAEEDFDWDIRLKNQLQDFAKASSSFLSQFGTDQVPHYAEEAGEAIEYSELLTWFQDNQNSIPVPRSPYGDGWDVLWLGNCGMRLEARRQDWQTLAIVRHNDSATVPANQYYSWDWDRPDPHPYKSYPNRTRLYLSQPTDGVCSIAYAVSQRGARKLLLELGLERADKAFDLMLQDFCQGGWYGGLAEPHACWGVLPSLFDSYRAAGPETKDSDIVDGEAGRVRDSGYVLNIQRSVRLNARKLLAQPPEEIFDQYPYAEGT